MVEKRWTQNSYIPEEQEADLSRSRTSQKNERVAHEDALSQLVNDIVNLKSAQLLDLGIPDELIEVLHTTDKIKSPIALHRHQRRIRKLLRDLNWQEVKRKLELLRAGIHDDGTFISKEARSWTDHLLTEMDAALTRFIKEYPDTDRPALRRLMRTYQIAKESKKATMRLQVEVLVMRVIDSV